MTVRVYDDEQAATRRALLQAAIRHIRRSGELPSFAEIATAASVSRRTAYRYFSTIEELRRAASDELILPKMNDVMATGFTSGDPQTRLLATVRNMVRLAYEYEAVFRLLIRRLIGERERRATRLVWFRTALEPLKVRIGKDRVESLVREIALAISFEGVLTFKDMFGATQAEATEAAMRIAEAIFRNAVAEDRRSVL